MPSCYAVEFRGLRARNPVPYPLIAESTAVRRYDAVKSRVYGLRGDDILTPGPNLKTDTPRYLVRKNSQLYTTDCSDIVIVHRWTEDHAAFLIGCSYSFEAELTAADLPPRHAVLNRNVSIYRTTVSLYPSGVFTNCTYVVSGLMGTIMVHAPGHMLVLDAMDQDIVRK
ncbi:hypothetical protein ACJ41O_004445 [Fusarium nematophilum]